MKSAKEIRKITNKKLEEMKVLKDYLEKVIAPQIEEKAFQGKETLEVVVDTTKVGVHEVAKELVANGYEVIHGEKYPVLKIYW